MSTPKYDPPRPRRRGTRSPQWVRLKESNPPRRLRRETKATVEQVRDLQAAKGGAREKAQFVAGLKVDGNLGHAIGAETNEAFFDFGWDPDNDINENPHHLFLC